MYYYKLIFIFAKSFANLSSPMPVGPQSPCELADTRRIRDHARVGVRHRSASGRRAVPRWQRAEEGGGGQWESEVERRRGRTDRCKWAVREMAPNRLVCRWTHYLSHADTTDTLCTLDCAHMASHSCTCITGNMNGRGRGRKLVM